MISTTTSRTRFVLLAAGLLAALLCLPGRAGASTMEELRSRFEQRFPKIRALKDSGKIGETAAGMLEAVSDKYRDDKEVKSVVAEDNADRTELYKLIAEKEKTTPETVAARNARRNFEKAKSGDWLKAADGKWTQKGK